MQDTKKEVIIPEDFDFNPPEAEVIATSEILIKISTEISEFDFVQRAGVEDATKLTTAHYKILVIQNVLDIAQEKNWGLAKNLDFIYGYNGAHWALIDSSSLKTHLGLWAEIMGVPWHKARDANFRKILYEQFLETAHFATPERKDNILIPLQNGTLEISNGQTRLREHDRGDFITYQLPYSFDADADAPLFTKYLREVLPETDKQTVLSEFLGYLFTRRIKLEKALVLYGSGANGKSVLFEIVSAFLGPQNVSQYALHSLCGENGYHRAMLHDKLVNYCPEINGAMDAATFKQMVSGEPVEARLPYGNPMIISDYAKLMFNTNSLPHDVEHTNAFFRRFLIIGFDVTIPPEHQDVDLPRKIIESELPGVFNWVMRGLDRIVANRKFSPCDSALKQLEAYRKQSDSVAMFLEEEGFKLSVTHHRPLKELYQKFKTYCAESGYKACAIQKLSHRLKNLGFIVERQTSGNVVFLELM